MSEISKELKEMFDSITEEEFDALLDETKVWNNVGPDVLEYFEYLKQIDVYPKKTKINK